nr:MAG TPA: hypothetical protein [Caudoviricetes sp.]
MVNRAEIVKKLTKNFLQKRLDKWVVILYNKLIK